MQFKDVIWIKAYFSQFLNAKASHRTPPSRIFNKVCNSGVWMLHESADPWWLFVAGFRKTAALGTDGLHSWILLIDAVTRVVRRKVLGDGTKACFFKNVKGVCMYYFHHTKKFGYRSYPKLFMKMSVKGKQPVWEETVVMAGEVHIGRWPITLRRVQIGTAMNNLAQLQMP